MELFSILSGIALVVLALVPGGGITAGKRLGIVALGVMFAAYGLFVMTRTSGTWHFPVVIFVIPFLVAFVLVGDLLEARRKAAAGRPAAQGPAPRPWGTPPGGALPGVAAAAPVAAAPVVAAPATAPVATLATSSACSACAAPLRAEVRFCTRCGAPRPWTAPVAGPALGSVALGAVVAAPPPTRAGPPPWSKALTLGGLAGGAVVVVTAIVLVLVTVADRDGGPSAGTPGDHAASDQAALQAAVGEELLTTADESMCVDPAAEGEYFGSQISRVVPEDIWVESAVFPTVVEAPFVRLAERCGYDYALEALNTMGIVGETYRALDAAMLAAAPRAEAPPQAEPEPTPEEAPPADVPPGLPDQVGLNAGGSLEGFGFFAPEADVIAYLTDRLGPAEDLYPVTCNDVVAHQYRWGDLVVFVDEQDLVYEFPGEGEVTVPAPYVGGWMLTTDGARTGLRTYEGLGKDDSVADLQALYPDAYSLDPGDGSDVQWEYFAGDLSSYVFTTTGVAPDDVVVSIRSGMACGE